MLAWKIALRYLFSKKSHGAVNVISAISVVGVAVATMAITIVLSVFNGFTDLAGESLAMLDPELRITSAKGKVVSNADSVSAVLQAMPDIRDVMPVIEERALAIYDNRQMPVKIKGVPVSYNVFSGLDDAMLDGEFLTAVMEIPAAQMGAGVATNLMARPGITKMLEIYAPRRRGRINTANPAGSFHEAQLVVSGVFGIGQSEYDKEYVFVPISTARELLEYDTEATALEIALAPGADAERVSAVVSAALGPDFRIQTRLQQQEAAFRMIQIEKWITFLLLAFILVIASFNIISTLSLLVIEKRANMQTLRSLGAPKSLIRRVFIIQGWLISLVGGVIGIILGTLLSLGQQFFGWVKLAGDPSRLKVAAYPVRVDFKDIVIVLLLVALVGLLTSQVTRFFVKDKQ